VPGGLFESLLLITAISILRLLNAFVDVHNQSNAMGWVSVERSKWYCSQKELYSLQ